MSITDSQTSAVFAALPTATSSSRLDQFGDRYTDLSRIGGGGICDVSRCFDTELNRWVALKCLNPITGRRNEDRERFLREPLLMELIDHKSVPRVFGRFRVQEPAPYFTMELVEGLDLCQILHGLRVDDRRTVERFSIEKLVDVIAATCDGLSAAHHRGILHRDIKPENIMVTEAGETRIIDWGIAKPTHDPDVRRIKDLSNFSYDRRRSNRLTVAGNQPGTLLYMSPEQAVGLMQLDERTDIYSLGAVLYDCLALTTFVSGDSTEQIVRRITEGPQMPPSKTTLRAGVPESLEQICMKALAMDRRDRFANMIDFRNALLEFNAAH